MPCLANQYKVDTAGRDCSFDTEGTPGVEGVGDVSPAQHPDVSRERSVQASTVVNFIHRFRERLTQLGTRAQLHGNYLQPPRYLASVQGIR